jgi:hypothetical protein
MKWFMITQLCYADPSVIDSRKMMTPAFLCIINWFLIFVISTRSVEVIKNRISESSMPLWFRGTKSRALAFLAAIIAFGASISSAVVGIIFMKWYILPVGVIGGLTLAGMTFKNFSPSGVVSYWPPFLILTQLILWFFRR